MKTTSDTKRRTSSIQSGFLLWFLMLSASLFAQGTGRIALDDAAILVDSGEPTYVQYGAKDLANYLGEISGKPVVVSASVNAGKGAKSIIALGEKAALAMGADLGAAKELGDDDSEIRSFDKAGTHVVIVAGHNPHGTNTGIATLMLMVRAEGKSPYLDGPLDLRNRPSLWGSRASPERLAAEISICLPFVERSGLEAFHRHRLDPARQSFFTCGRSWKSCRSHCPPRTKLIFRKFGGWWTTRKTSAAWKCGSCNRRIALGFPIAVRAIRDSVPIGSMSARRT